eukprot:UN18436
MAKFVQHLDAVNRVGTIGWQVVNPGHLGLNSSFPVPLSRLTKVEEEVVLRVVVVREKGVALPPPFMIR